LKVAATVLGAISCAGIFVFLGIVVKRSIQNSGGLLLELFSLGVLLLAFIEPSRKSF